MTVFNFRFFFFLFLPQMVIYLDLLQFNSMINSIFLVLSPLALALTTLATLGPLIPNIDLSSLFVRRRRRRRRCLRVISSFFSCVYRLLTAHLANDTLYLRLRRVRRLFFFLPPLQRLIWYRKQAGLRGRGQRGRRAFCTQQRPERRCVLDGDRWRLLPDWQRYCGAAKRELASKWSLSRPAG